MTIIYIPRLIATAEQAEALPGKTVILDVRTETGEVWDAHLAEDLSPLTIAPSRGEHCVALVPIEAEEDRLYRPGASLKHFNVPTHTRLVTPWTPTEEA